MHGPLDAIVLLLDCAIIAVGTWAAVNAPRRRGR